MAYYFKCPFFRNEAYQSHYQGHKKRPDTLAPKKGQTLVTCESAKVLCPNVSAKRFLYTNFCASDNWENCTVAQTTLMKYEREKK